jgi:hypothetical protein
VRGFAAAFHKLLKSFVRGFRGGRGANVPRNPYALRGAIGAHRGRMEPEVLSLGRQHL